MTEGQYGSIFGSFPDRKLRQLEELLATEGLNVGPAHAITADPRPTNVPLSYAQELLWLLDRASPGMTAYNSGLARRVRGALDVPALRRALDALVARHESLRTRYGVADDQPVQVVTEPRPVSLEYTDLRHLEPRTREAEALRIASKTLRAPFDLTRDLLLRASLARLGDDEYILALGSHHIAIDGLARAIIFRELGELYDGCRRGTMPALPGLPIQYADFAIWQRKELSGAKLQLLLEYWRGALSGAPDALALPTDFPRPAHPTFEGAQVDLVLDPATTSGLRAVGKRHDATLYMVLLAAYQTVLHRWTGQSTILCGSPTAGRSHAETEKVAGYFANTLVLRGEFGDDPTFGVLLHRMREVALDAYEHQEIPLEKLVLELREGDGRLSPAPLFQVVLTMHEMATGEVRLGEASLSPLAWQTDASKFDLTLLVGDRAEGLRFTLQYRTDLFRAETAARFLGHLEQLLRAVATDDRVPVSRIPLMTAAERVELARWNATGVAEGASTTLIELLARQMARVPARPAVVDSGGGALSYAELEARTNRLARHLETLGVGPNVPVGLLFERSTESVAALIGILKAGGAYLPLAVDAPAARLGQQIRESGITIVVTRPDLIDRVPPGAQAVVLNRDATLVEAGLTVTGADSERCVEPEALAYVMFTSGSTGVPKGVAVTHANVVHYARAISRVLADLPEGSPGDGLAELDGWHFGLVSTLAADLGHTSLWPALLAGGTLHLLGPEVTTDSAGFVEYVREHPLDLLKITPNHLRALAGSRTGAELAAVLPRRWLVTGGEALPFDFGRELVGTAPGRVLNHYGPTETTVGVLTHQVTEASLATAAGLGAQTVPLGRPLVNTTAYVVDPNGNEQPVGIPGELLIGGAGVTRGYLNRSELTAERFGAFCGEPVYRTGDRVRRLADGTLEFLGRTDDQVKVRGFRVELGEIAQALREHPGVVDAVAVLRHEEGAGNGEPQLVAYAVARKAGYAASHGERPTPDRLRAWLSAQLPGYMVPGAVVLLDALPLTANGKVDPRALPLPDAPSRYVAPRSETEGQVATIWAEVLKRERVGVTENFLELGGHSLLAIRVLGRLSKTFGVRLALRTLFDAPTVAQLAVVVDAARAGGGPPLPSIGALARDAHRIQLSPDGTGSEPANIGRDVRSGREP